jgi:type II secretory pathway component PulK
MRRRLLGFALLVAAVLAGAMAWAAFAPIQAASRDALFEIPKGSWARRMAGEKTEILPDTITLVLGVNDVLLLRNSDTVPQIFGPVLIMPGQDFRLPFEQAGEHPFACTAHASGQMTVVVQATPQAGWQRLRWRATTLLTGVSWKD